jgi:fascin 1/2
MTELLTQAGEQLDWTFGLISAVSNKYISQEAFGFQMNAGGNSLKKKQTLTLVANGDGTVCIRTHLNRFFKGDVNGVFTGDAEDGSDPETRWTIHPQANGAWAIRSVYGFYLRGTENNLWCFQKDLYEDSLWKVHLAMHPQVNLKNVMRKRYAHLKDGVMQVNEDIPWGADSLVTFVYFFEEGKYGFMAPNGQYLSFDGTLVDAPTEDCMFLLGFHDDMISLRDNNGRYLSCVGASATMRTNKQTISKDELFVMEDSEPQFTITNYRGGYLSTRQTQQVSCNVNLDGVSDSEYFQFEIARTGQWAVKNNQELYWGVLDDFQIHCRDEIPSTESFFEVEWLGNVVRFKCTLNGMYVGTKPNGQTIANFEASSPEAQFTATLINRPQLVLRGTYGFVAIKGPSMKIECNKATPEVFRLECIDGAYCVQGPNDLYWAVDGDGGITCNSPEPENFYLEFVEHSRMMIKCANGKYLQGEQNGGFKASGTQVTKNTLWEF